jgi:hypothetical protein
MAETVDSCTICLQPFEDVHSLRLKCGHKFHTACVADWVVEHATCPLCRRHQREVDLTISPYLLEFHQSRTLFYACLAIILILSYAEGFLTLFHLGAYGRGISRPEQPITECVALVMLGFSHFLTITLLCWEGLFRMFSGRLRAVFPDMEVLESSRPRIALMAVFHAITCYYSIYVEEPSFISYLMQCVTSLHTIELSLNLLMDMSMTRMDIRDVLLVLMGCLIPLRCNV